MPKVGMKPVRRAQLIAAAISSIHEYGLADATLARIARKAGVSTGIIHHYFHDKNDLIFETMRSLLEELRLEVVGRQQRASSPQDRLFAVIDASFDRKQFSVEVMTAWLALYGSAGSSASLSRIVRIYANRLESNLRHGFRQLMPEAEAAAAAEGTAAMIDGLWLQYALQGGAPGPDRARRLLRGYVELQIAMHGRRQ
ncbi:MAG: transcriptional regulator BetI [Pseudomonadota bacterium]